MKKLLAFCMVFAASAMMLIACPGWLSAGELDWNNLANMIGRTAVDVHMPQSCDQCAGEVCVQRVPVKDCVKGKKKVYDTSIRCEYVSIPETRYRWKTRFITKEIPCDYCKPICKTEDSTRCLESEKWDKTACGCGQLHCKTCQTQVEKVPCKHCGREPGKTSVKVHYRTCVKEAYIVYRQVKRPICVKQPRYEHVDVPITRYVCNQCQTETCGGECCGTASCGSGCQ